jgi:hypothetical protein
MTTKSEKTKTQIIRLLSDPSAPLSHVQIAKIVGCSQKTVQRIRREIKPEVKEVEGRLEEYRGLLRKRVPLDRRVSIISEVAEAKQNPFVRLRAIELANRIDGFDQLLDMKRPVEEPNPRPLFSIPDGATVTVNVQQNYGSIPQDVVVKKISESDNIAGRSQVIDIKQDDV